MPEPEINSLVQYTQKLFEICLENRGIRGFYSLFVEPDAGLFDGKIYASPLSNGEKEMAKSNTGICRHDDGQGFKTEYIVRVWEYVLLARNIHGMNF